jgi:hypothetical protein
MRSIIATLICCVLAGLIFVFCSGCGALQAPVDKRPAIVKLMELRKQALAQVKECYAIADSVTASTTAATILAEVPKIYSICEFDQSAVIKLDQMLKVVNEATNERDKAEIVAAVYSLEPLIKDTLAKARQALQVLLQEIKQYLDLSTASVPTL